jgi:peptidoglycan/xylan/chitin deacetylase (PgdA/CDA1 family)
VVGEATERLIGLIRQLRDARHGIVYCRRGLGVPRAVALTFDDGPSEWTPAILDAFDAAGAHATFFVLGRSIAGNEETLRRAAAGGHELGSHAWSHLDPADLAEDELREELERTNAALAEATGVRPRLFRPPYAESNHQVAAVARSVGLSPMVLRSVDPADWRGTRREEIVRQVLERAGPGAIVCLHDGVAPARHDARTTREETVAAVRDLVRSLSARGFDLVTVSGLLG